MEFSSIHAKPSCKILSLQAQGQDLHSQRIHCKRQGYKHFMVLSYFWFLDQLWTLWYPWSQTTDALCWRNNISGRVLYQTKNPAKVRLLVCSCLFSSVFVQNSVLDCKKRHAGIHLIRERVLLCFYLEFHEKIIIYISLKPHSPLSDDSDHCLPLFPTSLWT